MGDPERDKKRFVQDSPVTYLDGMTKPMLVIQGVKDQRVVQEESDDCCTINGERMRYRVSCFGGRRAWIFKKANEIKVYQHMLDFLEKHH